MQNWKTLDKFLGSTKLNFRFSHLKVDTLRMTNVIAKVLILTIGRVIFVETQDDIQQ